METPLGSDGSTPPREVRRWRDGQVDLSCDRLARESPVALVYNGIAHAVMMATPLHLEEFALGFSLSERIVDRADEIFALESSPAAPGHRVEITLSSRRFAALAERRRTLAGRTGCGLCGIEAIEHAITPPPRVPRQLLVTHRAVQRALTQLSEWQTLQHCTGAVHAAAWADATGNIALVREDVGRHNALDKLIGARAQGGCGNAGFAVISSRASYEMVVKAAATGIELLAAISAPTSLAVELAEQAGLTLVGFARSGRHTIYCHSQRLEPSSGADGTGGASRRPLS